MKLATICSSSALALMMVSFSGLAVAASAKTGAKSAHHAKTKITMGQARAIALKKEDGTIKSGELEKEKGKMIYSFDIATKDGMHEVNVNAKNGDIVDDQKESPADEAREAAADAKHMKSKK